DSLYKQHGYKTVRLGTKYCVFRKICSALSNRTSFSMLRSYLISYKPLSQPLGFVFFAAENVSKDSPCTIIGGIKEIHSELLFGQVETLRSSCTYESDKVSRKVIQIEFAMIVNVIQVQYFKFEDQN